MNYKKVMVIWDDAFGDSSIHEANEVTKFTPKRVSTMGYLIRNDNVCVTLAATKYKDGDLSDIIVIPISWVKNICKLKVIQ